MKLSNPRLRGLDYILIFLRLESNIFIGFLRLMTLVFKFSFEKDFDLSFTFLNKCITVELDYNR